MKHTPFISVLMPVYNGEKYLREAIDSVLAQTYKNFELLLINDGSTDSSKDIILSYSDPRIRYIENEQNLKLIATLNKGIDLAKGDYIARMDADDVCMPNRFEIQMDYLQKHPQISLCSGWAKVINEYGKITGRIKNIDEPTLLACATMFTCPIIHPAVICKSEVLKENKYDAAAINMEDFELWHRLALQGYQLSNVPQYILNYRWHTSNISSQGLEAIRERKNKILQKDLEEFMNKSLTEEDLDRHLATYNLYHFGKKIAHDLCIPAKQAKEWLEDLYEVNKFKLRFSKKSFAAFLFSRWIVYCLTMKKFFKLATIKLPWYNPVVLFKAFKLLLYK